MRGTIKRLKQLYESTKQKEYLADIAKNESELSKVVKNAVTLDSNKQTTKTATKAPKNHIPGSTPYCGSGPIPNGHRRATAKEALEKRQVRL